VLFPSSPTHQPSHSFAPHLSTLSSLAFPRKKPIGAAPDIGIGIGTDSCALAGEDTPAAVISPLLAKSFRPGGGKTIVAASTSRQGHVRA
jgi:hypothetical protein